MDMDEIYLTCFTTVYRYIRSISQNESLAEDITQETFFKAIKKIGQFRGDCDMRVWLCQIAKRTLYDHVKKEQKQISVSEPKEAASPLNLKEKMADHSDAIKIHTVLHQMQEPYKEVFSLRTFGELSFTEIGTLFEKSENWARVTYYGCSPDLVYCQGSI